MGWAPRKGLFELVRNLRRIKRRWYLPRMVWIRAALVKLLVLLWQVVTIKELPFIYTVPVSETSRGICEVHLNRLPCSKSNASGGLVALLAHLHLVENINVFLLFSLAGSSRPRHFPFLSVNRENWWLCNVFYIHLFIFIYILLRYTYICRVIFIYYYFYYYYNYYYYLLI